MPPLVAGPLLVARVSGLIVRNFRNRAFTSSVGRKLKDSFPSQTCEFAILCTFSESVESATSVGPQVCGGVYGYTHA